MGAEKDRPTEPPPRAPSMPPRVVGAASPAKDEATTPDSQGALVMDVDIPQTLAGELVGRYRLLLPIASGGMAQVWTARPEGSGLSRAVAVKLVRPEYAADEEYSRMFIDEAMVASAIHHPNVCETYDLGREGDLLYMVLDWVPGDSLSGMLQTADGLARLPYAIAARIVADACAGLHAAHDAVGPDGQALGIVHRDVSPPNILISVHGNVKVSDFGIAKARNQLHARTRTGQIKGKLAYLSPEQVTGAAVDRRADIYGMGCVLYVATLGVRPFGTGPSAMPKIVQGRFHRPSKVTADYPAELEAIVVRALSKDPRDRFQTADEFRLALERWMVESGNVATSSDVARSMQERMQPKRKQLVRAVMTSATKLPEALAYELLANQDRTATPTATSKLLTQQAAALRAELAAKSVPADDEPTRVDGPRAPHLHLAGMPDDVAQASDSSDVDPTLVSAKKPTADPDQTRTSIRAGRRLRRRRALAMVWVLALLVTLLLAYLYK